MGSEAIVVQPGEGHVLGTLRGTEREEALGMDVTHHGEEAYATGEGAILVTPEAGVEGEVAVKPA